MMEDAVPISGTTSDMNARPLNSGRLNNRAARFYWADEDPSPMRSLSIQQLKTSWSESHFEESPLVIAAISAVVIGVAIIIIILVGIWIRSRLFTEAERRNSENPNNASVRSSMSTLDEETYAVCVEMGNGAVLGIMHNRADNYCANDVTIEMKPKGELSFTKINYVTVPETLNIAENCEQSTCNDTDTEMTAEKTEQVNTTDSHHYSKTESIAQRTMTNLLKI